jgi:NADPH-dependent curcumin reductase CurA
MRSFAAGTIIASRHPGYAEGDKVMGMLGWQQFRDFRWNNDLAV